MGARPPHPRQDIDDLYQRYGSVVYRRARRLLGDEQWAKDVCQEVFVRLWRAGCSFDGGSPVAWLFRVTTNVCLNERRDRRRLDDLHERAQGANVVDPTATPLALLLKGIPTDLHAVAVYYYVDQMSQDEIAEVLGLSQRTVSNRLKAFRTAMEEREPSFERSVSREVP